jgi:hypothetical protein
MKAFKGILEYSLEDLLVGSLFLRWFQCVLDEQTFALDDLRSGDRSLSLGAPLISQVGYDSVSHK